MDWYPTPDAHAAEVVLETQTIILKGVEPNAAEGIARQLVATRNTVNKIMGIADRVAVAETGLNLAAANPAPAVGGGYKPQPPHRQAHEIFKTLNTGSRVPIMTQKDLHDFTDWKRTLQMRLIFSQIDYNQNRGIINYWIFSQLDKDLQAQCEAERPELQTMTEPSGYLDLLESKFTPLNQAAMMLKLFNNCTQKDSEAPSE